MDDISVGEIRVGVIGFGLAGRAFHAPFIAATPGMRLAAVVTTSAERAAEVTARHPTTKVVGSVSELLESEVDLVVVASPNRHHVEQAAAALAAGKHVVVDKPVAATGAEVRDLAERAAAADRVLTVFQNRRWDGDFRTVRELIDAGRLGSVTRFESRFERVARSARVAWKASQDPADLADIRYDLGSHVVDQAIALFGRPTSVYCDAAPLPVATDATILLTHAGGVRSYLRTSSVTTPAAPRFVVTGPDGGYRCWGLDPQEKASVSGAWPTDPGFGGYPAQQWGELITADGVETVPTLRGVYLEFYAGVAAAVRGDGPPPVPLTESIDLSDTLDAAFRSAATGSPVDL